MKRFEYRNLIGLFSFLFFVFFYLLQSLLTRYIENGPPFCCLHTDDNDGDELPLRFRFTSNMLVSFVFIIIYDWIMIVCGAKAHTHADMVDERWSTEHSSPNLSSSRIFSWNACRCDLNRSRGRAVISRSWDINVRYISPRVWKLTLNVQRNYQ